MNLKKIFKKLTYHYVIVIFVVVISIITSYSVYKVFFTSSSTIYVRIKFGQGLWWASTSKPNIWFINAIKKGEKEYDLFGKSSAELVEIRYYPAQDSDQQVKNNTGYDIFLTLKLNANFNKKINKFMYKRAIINVGSPIEVELSSVHVTGTVIAIDTKNFQDKYVDKTVLLVYQQGFYADYPYLYDSIIIGSKYFDGVDNVFEILDKKIQENIISVPDSRGNLLTQPMNTIQNIVVKAKLRVKEKNGQLFYAEEQPIRVGSTLFLTTPTHMFNEYTVSQIE